MMEAFQKITFESSEHLGPHWSALASGYAVWWNGQMYLTPAGQRYLATLEDNDHE